MKNFLGAVLERLRSNLGLVVTTVVVLNLELYRITVANFWGDETATITASTRTLSQLFRLVRNVDAVHAAYYFLMHFWVQAFGAGELSLRLPEAVAATAAAALVFAILQKRTNLVSAAVATIAFAVMPRVIWAASIGRSYAFTILFGVVLTWLLLKIIELEKPRRGWFVAYFVVAGFASIIFIYVLIMVAVQGLSLILLKVGRQKIVSFAWAALGALLVASPVLLAAKSQSYQIAWLRRVPPNFADSIFGSILFYSNLQITLTIWGLVAVGLALLLTKKFARARASVEKVPQRQSGFSRLVLPALLVSFLPSTMIYVYSMFNKPIFDGRYFSFAAGSAAVLLGVAVYELRFNLLRVLALVLVVTVSIGPSMGWRTEYRFGSDYRALSTLIKQSAQPSDAVFFAPRSKHCTGVCTALEAYADGFKNVKVIGLKNEYLKLGYLHDRYRSAESTLKEAAKFNRIWVIRNTPANNRVDGPYLNGLKSLGFKPEPTKRFKFESVTLFSR